MSGAHIAVVGASLAGLRTAEQLRAAGHTGPVTVLGDERYQPYNRPPLSKELLSAPDRPAPEELHAKVAFRRRASVADVDFRLGLPVVGADLGRGRLTLEDGSAVTFDGLVAATGLRPRRLGLPGPAAGRYALRTLDDCVALRGVLGAGRRVVVVGAGFIGCEVAATALRLGCRVTVVEPTGAPMNRVLGDVLARAVQRHHERAGIAFVLGRSLAGFTGDTRVSGVELDDGTRLDADVVVEAVGCVPNTEWLAGNAGLDLSDGVRCDNRMLADGSDRLVAAGDVARFPNPLFDDVPRRVEHWSIPADTARRAAATLTALLAGDAPDPAPFTPVPSFWSDQLDLRLQSFGSPGLADEVRVEEGDPDRLPDGVLALYYRQAVHVGTVAVNLPPARQRELRGAFAALAASV
ncbi:FAD-dependent oxidoreductase [Streptomyces sp. NPDC012461]|uniref:NAD(P)/FAD-dependent oxidoreductase n=1 Tax=unclassified Streptomyces TaxID=2593676 RepID=UPI0013DD60C9|nr:FAD-dependent oxidoreductase [Streptomyces sp. SID9913]MBM7087098.1 FAD-dependent oxidoreductase [Streptomyces sp. S12]NED16589.1 oxidoreductase [Streptomyces sp. SID9913]